MSAEHDHTAGKSERSLWIALGLTTSILVAEVIGGILTNSLALISDAAHMLTDAAALAIALAAIRIAKRPADSRRSFGYYRFEILAAAFNALMLVAVAVYILFEAYQRLGQPADIASTSMLWFATVGLVANLVSMKILAANKDDSLNVKGAYLEVWSDLLGSIGVIAGAIVIHFTGWLWIDSAVAVAIGFWVLPRTRVLLTSSVNILLEGVPEDVDLPAVKAALAATPGVARLHDLHVWAIGSGKTSLSVHVVHAPAAAPDAVLDAARTMLRDQFAIHHVTIQCERVACGQTDEQFHFGAHEEAHDAPHGAARHVH